MNARDQIYFALERFQRLTRPAETDFERVERGRREAREDRESAAYVGCDSASSCADDDVS